MPDVLDRPLALRTALVAAPSLVFVILHLTVIVLPIADLYPGDDLLYVVPTLLAGVEGRSTLQQLRFLFGPDDTWRPPVAWKLYMLGALRVLGPANAAHVYVGLALHGLASAVVWTLARRLGLGAAVAWLAAGLHLTAYSGSHAYLWAAGVQHVLTSLGSVIVITHVRCSTTFGWRIS